MDKALAFILKDQLIGSYSGHMSAIPYNPIVHGIFTGLMSIQNYGTPEAQLAGVLREMADALDPQKKD